MWERWGKLLTRHEGKVSPLFLQLVVGLAVVGNIGLRLFLYGPSAASQYSPAGQYSPVRPSHSVSKKLVSLLYI